MSGMDPERFAQAVRSLRAARRPRIEQRLRSRRQAESSLLVRNGSRVVCRFGLCPELAVIHGLCNSHDRAARRALEQLSNDRSAIPAPGVDHPGGAGHDKTRET